MEYGYSPDAPIHGNAEGSSDNRPDQTSAPCFGAGTVTQTDQGPLPIEWLTTQDSVLTCDNGYQPVLWVGKTHVTPAELHMNPSLCPIVIRQGSLGAGLPVADLTVSPQHRILIQSYETELLFGTEEVLCAAGYLTHWAGIDAILPDKPMSYHHILLPQHEIISSDGSWSESLFIDRMSEQMLSAEDQPLIQGKFCDVVNHTETARLCLTSWEGQLLSQPNLQVTPKAEMVA